MAELKALDKQEAWQELYSRLGTVPPTQRDAEWQALGERASGHLLDRVKPEETLGTLGAMKEQYPTIGKSKAFRQKRMEVGLEAYKATFDDYRHSGFDDPWLQSLKEFVADDPDTVELPLTAAKMVSDRLVAPNAIPLYAEAAHRQPDVACKDEALHKAVIDTARRGGVWVDELTTLVKSTCSGALKPALTAAADKAQSAELRGLCTVLTGAGATAASCTKS